MGAAVSSSHVVSAAPSSSHSAPAPAWGPSHGRQPSMNCSSMCPPQGHKSCQQTCSSKPAPTWAPLSMGLWVLPGACSSMGSTQGISLLRASPCSSVGSSLGCRWGSAPPWTSLGCRAQPASPGSAPWAAGEKSLLQHLEHLLPLLH